MTTIRELLARPCVARKPGLTGYKVDKCRCAECTQASRDHSQRRYKAVGYGTWQPLIDAEPARQHLRQLSKAGIGWQQAARLADVPTGTVSNILYGKTTGGTTRHPTKRCRPHIVERILAVQADPDRLTDRSVIDATGTRRRVQALAVAGWSIAEQATRVGRTTANYKMILTTPSVTTRTARAVRGLYEEMAGMNPVGGVATKTRRWAQRQGWVGSGAWDDATIDDPDVEPDLGGAADELVDVIAVERVHAGTYPFGRLTRAEQVELFRRYRDTGGTGTLCARWNINRATLRRLERAAGPTGAVAA